MCSSAPCRASEIVVQGLFKEAQRRMWQALLCARDKRDAFLVVGDLGEVLRGSGSRRNAEQVLRGTLRQEALPFDVSRMSFL